MPKIVVTDLKRETGKVPGRRVSTKRVVGPEGRSRKVWTLEARSHTFGEELQYVFRKNVNKARRANKRILGSTDLVTHKT